MRKLFVLFMMIILFFINFIDADLVDWLNSSVDYASGMINILSEDIKKKVGWLGTSDPALYYDFQQKTQAIQNQIQQELAQYKNTEDEESLEKVNSLLNQLREQQNKLLAQAEKKLTAQDFAKLKLEIEARQALARNELANLNIKDMLAEVGRRYATPYYKQQLNADNPHKNMQALVKQDAGITYFENIFKQQRYPMVKKGLEKFLGMPLTANQVFNTAFVGSGGGYRAMILTLGYLLAAQESGLLDASMYISTLSGSTWFLGSWILLGLSLNNLQDYFISLINANQFDLMALKTQIGIRSLANDIIWPKFIFDQPIGSIDLYGSLLAYALFAQLGDQRQKQHLSEQWAKIQNGNKPFPLYTAVSIHKEGDKEYKYNWYEFNPLEIRNLENHLSIPAYAFDWEFSEGKSVQPAPEQSFGYLMGIFGSAYAVNFKDLQRIQLAAAKDTKPDAQVESVKLQVTKQLINSISELTIGTKRASPAQVNNPFRKLPDTFNVKGYEWIKNRPYLTFVDGGIAFNIPIKPVLREGRDVRVIVIGESSGNAQLAGDLMESIKATEEYYKVNYKQDVSYTRVDDGSNKTLRLYKDLKNPNAPRIIVVNYLYDEDLIKRAEQNPALKAIIEKYNLRNFNSIACVENSFCNTFNFNYSKENFLQLLGIGYFNMKANEPVIKKFIKDELINMKQIEGNELGFGN